MENGDIYSLGRAENAQQNADQLSCRFAKNGKTITTFFFHESARAEASQAISDLNSLLPSPSMILSGDDQDRVEKIASKLQIPEFKGNLLPEDKRAQVAELEKKQHTLYLGDGINDLPALQEASLSGAPFANINMLTADVDFLFTDETMSFLPKLIKISKQRLASKRALIFYTLVYNASVLLIAFLGYMSPLYAAITMPLSSIVSILIVRKPLQLNHS